MVGRDDVGAAIPDGFQVFAADDLDAEDDVRQHPDDGQQDPIQQHSASPLNMCKNRALEQVEAFLRADVAGVHQDGIVGLLQRGDGAVGILVVALPDVGQHGGEGRQAGLFLPVPCGGARRGPRQLPSGKF